jgi:REP element-mobilizing transposase RayT
MAKHPRKHPRQESLFTKAGTPRKRRPRTFRRGRRPGRPRVKGSRLAHARRPQLSGTHPVHVTWPVRAGLPSLRWPKAMAAIRAAFVAGKVRGGFRLVHFSVQHNHVHMLCEADSAKALSRGLQGLAVRFARGLNRALDRRGSVLSDRYHSRVLSTPREVRWGLGYVLCNARKHNAQLLTPAHLPRRWLDSCSSAPLFDGWKGHARARPPRRGDPVAAPLTWLLREGWARGSGKHAGLLPTDHLPGPRSP